MPATSLGLSSDRAVWSEGMLSITTSGLVSPEMDVPPRMRMATSLPGSPDAVMTSTPVALPWSACSIDDTGVLLMSFSLITAIELVRLLRGT